MESGPGGRCLAAATLVLVRHPGDRFRDADIRIWPPMAVRFRDDSSRMWISFARHVKRAGIVGCDKNAIVRGSFPLTFGRNGSDDGRGNPLTNILWAGHRVEDNSGLRRLWKRN